jgi:hypothetical protein
MKLSHVTWRGPQIDDEKLLPQLPPNLKGMLKQMNGFIQFYGGLHVRGCSRAPEWHSLREAWQGAHAFYRTYPEIKPSDIPFAEEFLGDQFLLRGANVIRLYAESGELETVADGLTTFFKRVEKGPVEFLSLQPLLGFQSRGGQLVPGQLLAAYPPYCTKESAQGVELAAVPAVERHAFLSELASKIRNLPEGAKLEFKIT